jgi:hypothetical protein
MVVSDCVGFDESPFECLQGWRAALAKTTVTRAGSLGLTSAIVRT